MPLSGERDGLAARPSSGGGPSGISRRWTLRPLASALGSGAAVGLIVITITAAAPPALIAAVIAALAAAGWSLVPARRARSGAEARSPLLLRVAATAVVLIGAVLVLSGLVSLTASPENSVFDLADTTQSRPALVAALAVLALALIVATGRLPTFPGGIRPAARRALVCLLPLLVVAVQLRLAWGVAQYPPFDAAQIFSAAYRLSIGSETVLFDRAAQIDYFSMLPNNAFLASFFSVVFAGLHGLGVSDPRELAWSSIVVNVAAIDVSVALLWLIARRIGNRFTSTTTLVLAAVLLVLSPWLTVPYSDTLGLPFPLAIVALYAWWPRRWATASRAGLWASIGVVAAVGYSIKPTVVFAAAALLVVEALTGPRSTGRRLVRAGAAGLVLAITCGFVHIAVVAAIDATGVLPYPLSEDQRALPFTHFLSMGASGVGSYSQTDVDASLAVSSSQRSSTDLALYVDRVSNMGPLGYVVFLGRKLLFALTDGTFFQGREGVGDYDRTYFHSDVVSAMVQQVFPVFSRFHWVLSSTWQAVWVVALGLCLVPLRGNADRRPIIIGFRVTVVLLLVFLLFSESRSRYIFMFLPFFLLLAGFGAESARDGLLSAASAFRALVMRGGRTSPGAPTPRPSSRIRGRAGRNPGTGIRPGGMVGSVPDRRRG